MCSSVDNFVDNFQEFGKTCTQRQRSIPVSTFTLCVKVGKIPISTNRIGIIHIGKIPVFAPQKVGKIPTFERFSVVKSRKNSDFSRVNFFSSSAATTAIYTLLIIKSSRSTKIFSKKFVAHCRCSVRRYTAGGGFQPTTGGVVIAPALAAICRCRSRRSPSVAASCRKREGEALPCRRGTSEQFAPANCVDICSIAASSREEQIIKSFSEVIS